MPNKLTTSEFIQKARAVHGDTFDYSKVSYFNSISDIAIICKIHGEFIQRPNNHLIGHGCPICSQEERSTHIALTTEEFIQKAIKIHGDKYDYSKVNYVDCRIKVVIICKKHGSFLQSPTNHIVGKGCRVCANERKGNNGSTPLGHSFSTGDFIERASKIHGNKYDYSYVEYIDSYTKVKIKCLKHNVIFLQRPNNHIQGKTGCIECGKEKFYVSCSFSTEEFVKQAIDIHGDRYDYSLVAYVDWKTKVKIVCRKHGVFEQQPLNHKQGQGCPECQSENASLRLRSSKNEFVEKAMKVHNNLYLYDDVIYTRNSTKVLITCHLHGNFSQTPASHLRGSGCPKCNLSKGELKIKLFLDSIGIKYETGKKFDGCKCKRLLPFDFYIPDLNLAIEFDGRQHFRDVDFGGNRDDKYFNDIKIRDTIKTEFCKNQGIKLVRVSYLEFRQIETILSPFFSESINRKVPNEFI